VLWGRRAGPCVRAVGLRSGWCAVAGGAAGLVRITGLAWGLVRGCVRMLCEGRLGGVDRRAVLIDAEVGGVGERVRLKGGGVGNRHHAVGATGVLRRRPR